jgi:hypothetical protein
MSSFHVTFDKLTYIPYLSNTFYIKLNNNIIAGISSSDSMQKQTPVVKKYIWHTVTYSKFLRYKNIIL